MPRQRRVLSSWRSNESGDLVEGDLKIYVDEEDGSYELESLRENIGVTLGPDKSKKYTVICRILEPDK
ncbi:hypothetical protein EON63_10315 [archaeon]|nr:MAG: hypothetical protein EON63_10315 [archaeon]